MPDIPPPPNPSPPPYIAHLPGWLKNNRREWLAGDLTAGIIVMAILIPQGLAYTLLAGLPPQISLYASILPLIAYALFGSSMTLAIGPVAILSLMTASALQPLAAVGSAQYIAQAATLALLAGAILLVMGILRLGFLAAFLSYPVISGFVSGAALLILVGQLKYLFGISISSANLQETVSSLIRTLPNLNPTTTALGLGSLLTLLLLKHSEPLLRRIGLKPKTIDLALKTSPLIVISIATAIVATWRLDATAQVNIVGYVPQGLPSLTWPHIGLAELRLLWLPALLIALIGFVENVSIAQSLALKRGQRISADRELLGLGAANLASALSGGYPVAGGFARSVSNFTAGAATPLAGVITATLITLVIATSTRWIHYLPHAALAATIIVAIAALIDWRALLETWRYDKADALSQAATFGGVLLLGVEEGIITGVVLS
ncbi:MAG: sodium-independent anion transporter, partial [Betaproteobacteria bacterium]|nr:sodium-independent anion transporter [Betaproteobacteria bacterium]